MVNPLTDDHWYEMMASIGALKTLVDALARTHPDRQALLDAYKHLKKLSDVAALHSQWPEPALRRREEKFALLEEATFGGKVSADP